MSNTIIPLLPTDSFKKLLTAHSMRSPVNQRLIPERFDPLLDVADFTILQGHTPFNVFGTHRFHMKFSGSVANLASRYLQMRRFFRTDKSPGLPVSGSVALITALYLLSRQSLAQSLDTFIRPAFPGIGHKTVVFLLMAFAARLYADIERGPVSGIAVP